MGIVYKAEDPSLERLVAIKILPPKLLRNKEALRRFLREAKVAAKLDHPNIVPIYDIGEDNGIYYMVMEYLEGVTLREWLEERKEIRLDPALHLFKNVAEALDYAHRRKVIHRDVKPENIMVLASEMAKVMDFGIAVMDDRHSVTQMGAVLGTIAYISPEQAQGKAADVRSDIYSLGIVLFECLTGDLPFQARTPSEMINQHLNVQPPLASSLNAAVSEKLDLIVMKTLAKDPEERYQSMASLLEDLERAQEKPPGDFLESPIRRDGFQAGGPGAFTPPTPQAPQIPEGDRTEIMESLKNLLSPPSQPKEAPPQAPENTPDVAQKIVEGLSNDSFVKYRPIVDRIQKDLDAIREEIAASSADQVELEADKPRAMCAKCGAANDPLQKYCQECGSLLSPSVPAPQMDPVQLGAALLNEGRADEALKHFQEIIKKDPRSAEAHMFAGLSLLKNGRAREAVAFLRKAIDLNPDDGRAWEGLGDASLQLSHDMEALQAYQTAVRLLQSAAIWLKLAQVQRGLGQLDEARRSLSKAGELDPQNRESAYETIRILMQLGRYDEAMARARRLVEQNQQDVEALRLLGEIYEATNRFGLALQAYEKAVTIRPDDGKARYKLGNLLERQNPDLAIDHLAKAAQVEPGNPDIHVKLGHLYLKENASDSAITHFQKASQLNPNNPEVHRELGKLYMKRNELDQATVQLEWTIALDPTDPEAHGRLGQIYYKKNQTEQSIREYKTAIQFDPYNPELHENLGMVYYVEEDVDDAIGEMRKAVSLDPENVDYRKALGVMFESKGKLDEARKEYQKASEIAPYDPLAQGLLGRVYFEQNLMNLAIYQYQKSLDLDPKSYLMQNLLGKAYLKIGKTDDAVATLRKALEFAPQLDSSRNKQIVGKNYFHLGEAYFAKGDLSNADAVLQQATQLLPTFAGTFHLLGKTRLAMGDRAQAQQLLLHASRIATEDEGEIFADLAQLLYSSGDQGGAIRALTKAIESAPQQAAYHGFLGDLYFASGSLDQAAASYQQAARWEKNKKEVYRHKLATVLMQKKNYGEAAEEFKAACDLAPENWKYHQDLARAYEIMGRTDDAIAELEKARVKGPDPDALSLIQETIRRLKS